MTSQSSDSTRLAQPSETARQILYGAAISCSHTIDEGKIVLRRDDKKPGNALSQLADRLEAIHATLMIPAGWKLVPDDENMTDEQAEAISNMAKCCGGIAYDIYRVALEAAPEAPTNHFGGTTKIVDLNALTRYDYEHIDGESACIGKDPTGEYVRLADVRTLLAAPPAATDKHEAFKQWHQGKFKCGDASYQRNGDGSYMVADVRHDFEVWQAGAHTFTSTTSSPCNECGQPVKPGPGMHVRQDAVTGEYLPCFGQPQAAPETPPVAVAKVGKGPVASFIHLTDAGRALPIGKYDLYLSPAAHAAPLDLGKAKLKAEIANMIVSLRRAFDCDERARRQVMREAGLMLGELGDRILATPAPADEAPTITFQDWFDSHETVDHDPYYRNMRRAWNAAIIAIMRKPAISFDNWYTSITIEGELRHNMERAWNAVIDNAISENKK